MALKRHHETVQILLTDGSMETDNAAIKVGSQLISSALGGAAMPVRRPTDTYVHRELNRAPIKRSSVHFETVDPPSPDFDSQFVLRDAYAIWNAARLDLDTEVDNKNRLNNIIQVIAVVASSLFMFASFGVAAMFADQRNQAEIQQELIRTQQQQQIQSLPPPPPPPGFPSLEGR